MGWMSGHDMLVPLSIEHHFQSKTKSQWLGGLWNYSTAALEFQLKPQVHCDPF